MALHGENASPGTGMDEPKSPSGGIGLLGFLRALKLGFVRPGPVGTEFHEQAPGFNFFDEVPYDMMVYIFSFLDIRSLCAVARVQRTWYSAANDPALWKSLCLKECQYCTPARAGCRNWKHLYEKWARQTNRVYALELLWSSIGNRTTHFPTGTISYWREHGFGNEQPENSSWMEFSRPLRGNTAANLVRVLASHRLGEGCLNIFSIFRPKASKFVYSFLCKDGRGFPFQARPVSSDATPYVHHSD
eukprot:Rmarinus@m.12016